MEGKGEKGGGKMVKSGGGRMEEVKRNRGATGGEGKYYLGVVSTRKKDTGGG